MAKIKQLFSLLLLKIREWLLWILLASVIVLSAILFFRNKKIKKLESDLFIAQSKLAVEKLSVKFAVEKDKLKEIKATDVQIRDEINRIEKSLAERLPKNMTAAEIIAKFKEIGTR